MDRGTIELIERSRSRLALHTALGCMSNRPNQIEPLQNDRIVPSIIKSMVPFVWHDRIMRTSPSTSAATLTGVALHHPRISFS